MAVAFSTQGLEQRDRIPFWVEVATREFFRHGFSASPRSFTGDLHSGELENISLGRVDCGPCEVTRTSRDAARDDIDTIILCLRLAGRSVFTQGAHEVMVDPGMLLLQDVARPLKINFLTPTKSIFVTLPRNALQARLGNAGAAGISLSTDRPVAGLASQFLSMLVSRLASIDPPVRSRLAEQALDLVALAFSAEGKENATELSSPRTIALLRLKAAIEARLSDPGLKPAEAAAAAGISVRYANDLLSEENFSIERYILYRRLERCRSALEDPLQSHRMIGEIAFSWGFSDHSHFTRRFREQFGVTPGDCRRYMLEVHGPVPGA